MRKEFSRLLERTEIAEKAKQLELEREIKSGERVDWSSMFTSRDSMTESHLTQHCDPCTYHERKESGFFNSKTRSSVVRARALRKFKKRNN